MGSSEPKNVGSSTVYEAYAGPGIIYIILYFNYKLMFRLLFINDFIFLNINFTIKFIKIYKNNIKINYFISIWLLHYYVILYKLLYLIIINYILLYHVYQVYYLITHDQLYL